MKRSFRSKLYWATGLLVGLAALVFLVGPQGISADQAPSDQAVSGEAPTATKTDALTPEIVTPEAMKAAEASSLAPARATEVPFRPTVQDENAYRALKEQAGKLAPGGARPAAPAEQGPLAVIADGVNCNGQSQAGLFPPDTHGAIGVSHYVQIVNSRIIVFPRANLTGDNNIACGPAALNVSLNSFFNYTAQTLFDPRVVYDHVFNRFIVTAEAFRESSTVQRQFIAVSTSSNGAGSYFKYNFNVARNSTEFWDYPQLGFDDTAVLMTANIFNPGYVGSRVVGLSKHRMYAGLPLQGCIFSGGSALNNGTIAPPIVRDANPQSWFVSANTSGNFVRVTRFTAMDRVCGTFLGSQNLSVAAFTAPADAPQPGTAQRLDTLDARFVNSSTQRGSFLYNTHSVAVGPAAVRYYKLNVPSNVATQTCTFFSSGSSSDFNASVVRNDTASGLVAITFSRSDAATRPQVRFLAKADGTSCLFAQGTAVTSPSSLTGNTQSGRQRWGDYSAINIDPTNQARAWGTNEHVNSGGATWASRIFKISIP